MAGLIRHVLYRDMKCWMICQSHAAQLPVLNGRKCSMNQATFHSTFPIFFITKIFRYDKIKNPAFLSCSGINSTRNEDGGKEISFWNVTWFKKVGRHLCPFSIRMWGCNSYHFSYLFACRPYLAIYTCSLEQQW